MSGFDHDDDDEQDVPFADHPTEQRHQPTGDDDESRRSRSDDAKDAEDADATGATGGGRPGGGTGDPFGEIGEMAGEAMKVFGVLRDRFVAPLLANYPEVREHLGSAGAEVASAYRAVIRGKEKDWSDEPRDAERITVEQIDEDEAAADDERSEGSQGSDTRRGTGDDSAPRARRVDDDSSGQGGPTD